MKQRSETVVFFGSGPVAARSLELLAQDFDIEAVITKPKPPHHKGVFPVLEVAEKLNLKILLTSNKKDLEELFKDSPVKSTLGVVIDYGIIIPTDVIDYFPLGIVNSHFSLLPRWRGADPISYSVLNGDQETGVSLMLIVEALDEGPLLKQESINLDENIDSKVLTERLILLSDRMLKQTLPEYFDGKINQTYQPSEGVTYSSDFNKAAEDLEREIRAYIEWPRSRTEITGQTVVITKAHVKEGDGKPGTIFQEDKELGIFTSNRILIIDKLIPSGKKEMDTTSYLAGYSV
jgi:methionyl-tRNA formyltransferase